VAAPTAVDGNVHIVATKKKEDAAPPTLEQKFSKEKMTLSNESPRSHLKRARRYGSLQWFTTHNHDRGLERFDLEDLCLATDVFDRMDLTRLAEFGTAQILPVARHIWNAFTLDGTIKTKRTR